MNKSMVPKYLTYHINRAMTIEPIIFNWVVKNEVWIITGFSRERKTKRTRGNH